MPLAYSDEVVRVLSSQHHVAEVAAYRVRVVGDMSSAGVDVAEGSCDLVAPVDAVGPTRIEHAADQLAAAARDLT